MKPVFEFPELLTLDGNKFTGDLILGSSFGNNCSNGCTDGCCNGCDAGGGSGKKPEDPIW